MSNGIGRLIFSTESENENSEFIVREKEYFIGSGMNCHLRVANEDVPAYQCVIRTIGKQVSIVNLKQDSPVYLNEKEISPEGDILKNDDKIRIFHDTFKWENNAETNGLSTSLCLDNPVHEPVPNRLSEPHTVLNYEILKNEVQTVSESFQSKQEDEPAAIKKETPSTPKASTSVKKPYVSTSCRVTRSSVASGSKIKRLANTCIKRRRSRNMVTETSKATKLSFDNEDNSSQNSRIVKTPTKKATSSPFTVTNTFVTDPRKEVEEKNELELEVSSVVKTARGDGFEDDSSSSHSGASQLFHSTPKPSAGMKYVDSDNSPLSSSVDFNFEISADDDVSKLKATEFRPESIQAENDVRTEDTNSEAPVSKISTDSNLRQRSSVLRKTFDEESCDESSMDLKLEVNKGSSTSKKSLTGSAPAKRLSEIANESRRNTRGRTSMLRKTFEEKTCDGDSLNKEKSLTTPEKTTEISNTMKSTMYVSESAIDSTMDTRSDLKFIGESSKTGFTSVSDENDTCESSFIDKYKMCNVVKTTCSSPIPTVAKCARNLSYISPPENNRSQEYMDSMVSTPKKSPSVHESMNESYNVTMPSFLSATKEGFTLDESLLSPLTSARKRRSTGFVPFVGTPSNVYRTTRKISTPFNKSYLSRTSTDFETNIDRSRGQKRSVERRSTPYKANTRKSSMRDSVSLHPPIKESISFEEDAENEPANDSKFRFVTVRRRYRCGESDFATENKILEESELQNDDSELDDENDSLDDGVNYSEECSEAMASARITINSTSMFSEAFDDVSTGDKTKIVETRKSIPELKSILTPLPKTFSSMKDKSAKRVTFVLPSSAECSEQNTLNEEESFAMISCGRKNASSENDNTEEIGTDEELYESDKPESDFSYNSVSVTEGDISNGGDKCEESSANLTADRSAPHTSSGDLSGVEHIISPEASPSKTEASEVESGENTAETKISVDSENLPEIISEQSKTKQQYSPGVFLSGVKSLLTSPEQAASSFNVEKSKCTLNFEQEIAPVTEAVSYARKISSVVENIEKEERLSSEVERSSEMCLSGVKSLLKTPEKKTRSSTNASKRNLSFRSSTAGKPTPTDKTTQVLTKAPHLVRKSAGISKVGGVTKTSRMCKSLNMNEIKSTTNKAENIPQFESAESPKENNSFDARDDNEINQVTTENQLDATSQLEGKNVSEETESSAEIFTNIDIPKITITEATFLDDQCSPEIEESEEVEHQEPANASKHSEESIPIDVSEKELTVKTVKVSGVSSLLPDAVQDDGDNFETSDIEDQYEPSNDDDTISSDNSGLDERSESPVFSQVTRKSTRTPLSMTKENEMLHSEKDAARDTSEIAERMIELPQTDEQNELSISSNPSERNETLPETEISEEMTPNESKSSLEVMVSDRDSSRLSDLQSVEDIGAENIKPEDEISAEIETATDNLIEKEPAAAALDESVVESESTLNSQDVDIKIDVSSDLVHELDDELEDDSPIVNRSELKPNESLGAPEPEKTPNFVASKNDSCFRFPENPSLEADDETPHDLPSQNEVNSTPNTGTKTLLNSIPFAFVTPRTEFSFSTFGSPSYHRRCSKSGRIHSLSTNSLNQSSQNTAQNCSISSDTSLNETNKSDDAEKSKEPQELFDYVVAELKSKFNEPENKEHVEPVSSNESEIIQKSPEQRSKSEENSDVDVRTDDTPIQDCIVADSLVISVTNLNVIIPVDILPSEDDNSNILTGTIDRKDDRSAVESATSPSRPEISQTNAEICLLSSGEQQISIGGAVKCLIEEADSTNKSLIVSLPRSQDVSLINAADEVMNSKQVENTLSVRSPQRKRSLRIRKGKNVEIESTKNLDDVQTADLPKPEKETRRRRGRPLLNRKDAAIERNEVQDNKENVCSLLEVLDKSRPKRIKLSEETVVAASSTLEKTRRKTRQLKNLENFSTDSDESGPPEPTTQRSKRVPKKSLVSSVPSKRKRSSLDTNDETRNRCSIVLPILDPEIIRCSPVKVDEDGNISRIGEQEVSKRKRVTRVTKKAVDIPAELASSKSAPKTVRQKQKAVTFKSISPSEKNTATNEIRNNAANRDEVPTPPVTKRITRKQSNDVKAESQATEKKTRGRRVVKPLTKFEDEIKLEPPKRTRTRAKEVIESDSETVPVDPPKRTRTKAKEVVEIQPAAVSTRPKRGIKSNLEEPTTSQVHKNPPKVTRRARNVAGSEENVITKNTQVADKIRGQRTTVNVEPAVEKGIARKRVTKADLAESVANEVAKKNSTQRPTIVTRTTHGRKKETVDYTVDAKKNEGPARATRSAKNKKPILNQPSTSKSESELSPKAVNSKPVEKRKVVTKSKTVLLTKKGRVSLTLKTTDRLSLTKPVKTNRLTRSKAK